MNDTYIRPTLEWKSDRQVMDQIFLIQKKGETKIKWKGKELYE